MARISLQECLGTGREVAGSESMLVVKVESRAEVDDDVGGGAEEVQSASEEEREVLVTKWERKSLYSGFIYVELLCVCVCIMFAYPDSQKFSSFSSSSFHLQV